MDREAFERYLKLRPKRPLELRSASSVASRCLRIETAFGVELDRVITRGGLDALIERVKSNDGRKRLDYVGPDKAWYATLVAALTQYAEFRAAEPLK